MKTNGIVLTFGGAWARLFEQSLSRKMAGLEHIDLGNPKFSLPFEKFLKITDQKEPLEQVKDLYERLVRNTTQASELLFKFSWYVQHSDFVLVDTELLDTAIGHQLLVLASSASFAKPCYGVGVTPSNSPLAPAFLRGILYPSLPDDLVSLILQNLDGGREPVLESNAPTKEFQNRRA